MDRGTPESEMTGTTESEKTKSEMTESEMHDRVRWRHPLALRSKSYRKAVATESAEGGRDRHAHAPSSTPMGSAPRRRLVASLPVPTQTTPPTERKPNPPRQCHTAAASLRPAAAAALPVAATALVTTLAATTAAKHCSGWREHCKHECWSSRAVLPQLPFSVQARDASMHHHRNWWQCQRVL